MVRLFLGLFKQFTQSANFIWKLRCKLYETEYSVLTTKAETLLSKLDYILHGLFLKTDQNGSTRSTKIRFLRQVQAAISTSFLNAENDFPCNFWITINPSNLHLMRSRNLLENQSASSMMKGNLNQLSEILLDFGGQALKPHWLEYLTEGNCIISGFTITNDGPEITEVKLLDISSPKLLKIQWKKFLKLELMDYISRDINQLNWLNWISAWITDFSTLKVMPVIIQESVLIDK